MTSRAEDWSKFYLNLDCNHDVNQQMAHIMGFSRFQMSSVDCVSNLANKPGLAILAVNGFNELFVFHSVQYQIQNLFCSESKLLGLSRGSQRADCYRLDPTTNTKLEGFERCNIPRSGSLVTSRRSESFNVQRKARNGGSSISPNNNPQPNYYVPCSFDPGFIE